MAVIIDNLTKTFDGNKFLFENLSFEFPSTGVVRIAGDSGTGKTTLLRIIAGLEKRYTGTVVRPERYSFVFQEYRLFPWLTALANITVTAFENATEHEVEAAKAMLLRLGFSEDELNLKPDELSGGMKQRVALARAFLHSSPLLILDEPTKELDSDLATLVYDIVKEEAERRLVILVTHGALPGDFVITDTISLG